MSWKHVVFGCLWLGAWLGGFGVLPAAQAAKQWRDYTDCTLIANKANDGDSFHVNIGSLKSAKAKHKLIRLYFVDTPESDASLSDRLEVQRAYWNLPDIPTVIKCGKEAVKFTEAFLKDGFTIYSRLSDALGRSKMDRDYGMVINSEGKCLITELVRNGLARLHGSSTDLSELPEYKCSADVFWRRLRQAEAEAKREKRGAWAYSGAPLSRLDALTAPRQIDEQEVVLSRAIYIYPLQPLTAQQPMGRVQAGVTLQVLKGISPERAHIRFTTSSGQSYEGAARFVDLGL
jgi:endonuclease YncB( thermonuclease family)